MSEEPFVNKHLRKMLELGGSDLHLAIGSPAKARIHGGINPIDDEIITPERMRSMLEEICLPKRRWKQFMETHDLDFAHEIPGLARFRVNYFYNYSGSSERDLPAEIRSGPGHRAHGFR